MKRLFGLFRFNGSFDLCSFLHTLCLYGEKVSVSMIL